MEAYVSQLGLVVFEVVVAQAVDLPFFSYVSEVSRNFLAQTMREVVPALMLVVAFDIGGLRDKKVTLIRVSAGSTYVRAA